MSMVADVLVHSTFPTPLANYPPPSADGLLGTLATRVAIEPFNAVATGIFLLAVIHTFMAARFTAMAHRVQERQDEQAGAAGQVSTPSVAAELLHLFGEVEVVFGVWAVVLLAAIALYAGWGTATHYLNDTVDYTEAMFVVTIMALASTRPIVSLAEAGLRIVAGLGGATPAAWWFAILTIGPLLGSFTYRRGPVRLTA
jgi:hypothetical protein